MFWFFEGGKIKLKKYPALQQVDYWAGNSNMVVE